MGGQDYSSGGFEAEGKFLLVKGVFFFWKETLVIKVEEFLVRLGDRKVSKRGVFQVDFILHMDPVLHGVCHRLTREATLPLSRRCLGRESPMPALTTTMTTAATSLLPWHRPSCKSSYFKFMQISNMNLLHMKILFSITEWKTTTLLGIGSQLVSGY